MDIIFFTPRAHPNLKRLLMPLLKIGVKEDEIALLALIPDVIIYRFVTPNILELVKAVDKTMLKNEIFYTQDSCNPIWAGRLMAGVRRFSRSLRGYPSVEISPAKNLSLQGRPNSHSEIHHFPYPSDLDAMKVHQPVEKVTRIVCVAKWGQPRKRIDWLLSTLGEINYDGTLATRGIESWQPGNPFHLARAKNYKRRFTKLKRRYSSQIRVEKLINLSHSETETEISTSELFVLPSKSEPFTISPMEAIEKGVPILISSSNGAQTYAHTRPEAVFDWGSKSDFREKLQNLLMSRDLRQEQVTSPQTVLRTNHSGDFFVELLGTLAKGKSEDKR